MQQQAAGREGGRTGGLAGDVEDKRKAGREGGETSGLSRTAAARRRHGHDDAAVIAATTNIPGRASVRDRIDRAKGIAVRQAIQLKIYTTRSLKRDETAEYIRFLHATAEGDPDTVMCNAEGDGLESDRRPMDSDTNVRNLVDDFSD
jgi:general stress protein YciG